jgi:hypothetical protein
MSSSNRRSYLTAAILDQALLNSCADNLDTRIEMVLEIEKPGGGYIYASDRNKYVGGIFYEALLVFPTITRTVGEWLSPSLQFSILQIELSNADGRFNEYLPGGGSYDSFIGRSIIVKIGLAEQAATYMTIFAGKITEVGGFSRSVSSVSFIARDDREKFNVSFPKTTLSRTVYPDLDDGTVGKVLPVIYGDYTTALENDPAIVPVYVLNGANSNVIGGSRDAVQFRIAEHDLTYFDNSNVYLKKSDVYYQVTPADVVNVAITNNYFEILQNTGNLWAPDGAAYLYEKGDEFFVRVKGKDLSTYDDNIVWQARDILITQAGAISGDFDSNWTTYRDKAAPAQSSISTIKSRIWENEPTPVMEYVLSLLEQVRLEVFIDKNLKLKINSLHFEDWNPSPSYTIKNWDIVEKSFRPRTDERNNFNRAQASFDYHPNRNQQSRVSSIYHNIDSFNQIGKFISKKIEFPNLYIDADVSNQLIEILRMSSSLFETVECSLTWRSLLLDVGDFVFLNIEIGSVIYENVPAMIRTKGYNPTGIQIPVELWSMQILPFPGYAGAGLGIVGGYNQTINEET